MDLIELSIWMALYLAIGMVVVLVTEALVHYHSRAVWPSSDGTRFLSVMIWPIIVFIVFLCLANAIWTTIAKIYIKALIEIRDTLER